MREVGRNLYRGVRKRLEEVGRNACRNGRERSGRNEAQWKEIERGWEKLMERGKKGVMRGWEELMQIAER